MVKYPPDHMFEPSYLQESGLTPAEAKYILNLRECMPDLNKSGFANATVKEMLINTTQAYWNGIEKIIEKQRAFTKLGMPPLPVNGHTPLFMAFNRLYDQTIQKLALQHTVLNKNQINLKINNTPDSIFGHRLVLGGEENLFLTLPSDFQYIYSDLEWKNVKYNGSHKTAETNNVEPSRIDNICKKYGLSYITFPVLTPYDKQDEYLQTIEHTAHTINSKFGWTDSGIFGNHGGIGISIKTNILKSFGSASPHGRITLGTTKIGLLAHEWFHTLDKRLSSGLVPYASSYTNGSANNNVQSEMDINLAKPLNTLLTEILPAARKTDYTQQLPEPNVLSTSIKNIATGILSKNLYHVKSAFTSLVNQTNYWIAPYEQLARAFDAYITDGYSRFLHCVPSKISKNNFDKAFDKFTQTQGPLLVEPHNLFKDSWARVCNAPSQAGVLYEQSTPQPLSNTIATSYSNSMNYMTTPTMDMNSGPELTHVDL